MDDVEPSKILFSEDGKTVTMSVEKFRHMSTFASKNWQAEISVIYAHMILHPDSFSEAAVEEATEEFIHGTRLFIQELQALQNNQGS